MSDTWYPTQLYTPGTHNSGMWRLATHDYMGNQEPFSAMKYWSLELVKERLANVSVAQDANLVQQLRMGIRAFDIRVAWYAQELRFAHTFLGPRARKWIDRLRAAYKEEGLTEPIYIKLRWDWANREVGVCGRSAFDSLERYLKSCPEITFSHSLWWDSPTSFTTSPSTKVRYVKNWYYKAQPYARWLSWDLTPDEQWVVRAIISNESLRDLADDSHQLLLRHLTTYPCEVIAIDFADASYVQLLQEARNKTQ